MTDAEYEAQKARLWRHIAHWEKVIGLRWFRMTYEYDRSSEDFHQREGIPDGYTTLAHGYINWPYQRAIIVFNLPVGKDCDDEDDLEYQIVHELAHPLLQELAAGDKREDAKDHSERATTQVAHALLWARAAGQADVLEGLAFNG